MLYATPGESVPPLTTYTFNSGTNPGVGREPQVLAALGQLTKDVEEALVVFGALTARLSPVMSAHPQPVGEQPKTSGGCAIAVTILRETQRVQMLRSEIQKVIDQLEV